MKITKHVLLIFLTVLSCKFSEDITIGYTYSEPVALNDWETSNLTEVGMDQALIEELAGAITVGDFPDVHSMLIIKEGKLVFEDYFNGFSRNDLHVLFSATKSYASTLVGIALDRGDIASVDDLLADYFPDKSALFTDGKELMTIGDLLTMTSGLEWDEWTTSTLDSTNSHERMMQAYSQVEYVLGLPLTSTPGVTFTYNTGLSNLMAPIIEYAAGQPVEAYMEQHLFDLLGIETYVWIEVIDNYPSTGGSRGGLEMLPKDMAKLGQLFLDSGEWNSQRVVSKEWVQQALEPRVAESNFINYGYQWWNRTYFTKDGQPVKEYDAVGDGGQWIFIFPELELVVVFTAGNYTWVKGPDLMFQHVRMVQDYILPSIH